MNMLWKYKNDFDGLWPEHLGLSGYLQKQYANFVKEWVEYPILEIGSGTGWLGDFLTDGYYLGIDTSLTAVQIARLKKRNIQRMDFMLWEGYRTDFNTVVSIATLQYQPNLLEASRRVRHLLPNKGRYVFIERFTDRHYDEGVIKITKAEAMQTLKKVFRNVVVRNLDVNFLRYLILKKRFPDWICRLEPILRMLKLPSWYYMGVCQK